MKANNQYQGIQVDTRGITLWGLVVTISIIMFFSIIVFVLSQSFISHSRDAFRTTAVKTLETGLDFYLAKNGILPEPDDVVGNNSFHGKNMSMVGTIGNNLAKDLQMLEAPLDPRAHVPYWYAIDSEKRFYQIALTFEQDTGYTPCVNVTYANSSNQANVFGTYNYPLKIQNTLYSIPSLLSIGSGVLNDDTAFIVDRGTNVPYQFGGDISETQSVPDVLNIITGEKGLTLTGVNIPSVSKTEYATAKGIPSAFSGVAMSLGLTDKNKLGGVVYGEYSKSIDTGNSSLCNVENHNSL